MRGLWAVMCVLAGCAAKPAPQPQAPATVQVDQPAAPDPIVAADGDPRQPSVHPCEPVDASSDELAEALETPPPRDAIAPVAMRGELEPLALHGEELRRCAVLRGAMALDEDPERAAAARYAYGRLMVDSLHVDAAIDALEPLVASDTGERAVWAAHLMIECLVLRITHGADEVSATRAMLAWLDGLSRFSWYELAQAESLRDLRQEIEPQLRFKLGEILMEEGDYRGCGDVFVGVYEQGGALADAALFNAAICADHGGERARAELRYRTLVDEFPDSRLAAEADKRLSRPSSGFVPGK